MLSQAAEEIFRVQWGQETCLGVPGGRLGGPGGTRGSRGASWGSHGAIGLVSWVSWLFMRHICLYTGVQIFSAYGRAGSPEVVQEALADLKIELHIMTPDTSGQDWSSLSIWMYYTQHSNQKCDQFEAFDDCWVWLIAPHGKQLEAQNVGCFLFNSLIFPSLKKPCSGPSSNIFTVHPSFGLSDANLILWF